MAAKKTVKKTTASLPKTPVAKKAAVPAAKKAVAKKAAAPVAKKAVAKKTAKPQQPAPKPTTDMIARSAYLIYRRRVEQGLPGDSHSDWLEAERQHGVIR